MVDVAAAPAKKGTKTTKKSTKPKVAAHPSYDAMVVAALKALKDRKGTSGTAIKKYISANYKVVEKSVSLRVRSALKRGVASGALKQYKGVGASGSFKLPEEAKKPTAKKAKKSAAAKKAKSPKKVKKTTVKKTTVKKAPKKAAKKAAKSPAKKPVAKKTKKPTAKKAAPKK